MINYLTEIKEISRTLKEISKELRLIRQEMEDFNLKNKELPEKEK